MLIEVDRIVYSTMCWWLVCISITTVISKRYIFIDFTPLASETPIFKQMPV